MKKLSETEQFIIGQALTEIKKKSDIVKVVEKVSGTVVGINSFAMKVFKELADKKGRLIK